MTTTFLVLVILFVFLEIFESSWQKSETLFGLIHNNYYIYKKNIFFYFALHSTFFYTIILAIYLNNFGFWMSSIIVIKFLDIAFKLSMFKKMDNGIELNELMPMDMKMTNTFRYFNVVIYPLTFIFAVV